MKYIILLLTLLNSILTFSQREAGIDLSKSDYVVVKYQDVDKSGTAKSGIRFINTATGKVSKFELENNTTIQSLEHVKIDALGIDIVVMITEENVFKTQNSVFKLMIYNKIGDLKKEIKLDNSQVKDYIINNKNGRIVLFVLENSTNNLLNQKQTERIFDLKTFEEILIK